MDIEETVPPLEGTDAEQTPQPPSKTAEEWKL